MHLIGQKEEKQYTILCVWKFKKKESNQEREGKFN